MRPEPAASRRDYAVDFDETAGTYRSSSAPPMFAPGRADPVQYAIRDFDDTVLGLTYRTVAPRRTIGDPRWAGSLRGFARAVVWCLPAGVLAFALASVWGAPTSTREPNLVSPGTWLVFALLGLVLWLAGVFAVGALVAATPMRVWGLIAVLASIAGSVPLAAVAGVAGLARPAIHRTAAGIEDDPAIAAAADSMQAQLLDHNVGRTLLLGGVLLLAIGAFAVAGSVLGSRGLSRVDGWLLVVAAAAAIGSVWLGWTFVLVLAAMVALAGTLGLAFTVSRLVPEGPVAPPVAVPTTAAASGTTASTAASSSTASSTTAPAASAPTATPSAPA